jgi:hypothetical protein
MKKQLLSSLLVLLLGIFGVVNAENATKKQQKIGVIKKLNVPVMRLR